MVGALNAPYHSRGKWGKQNSQIGVFVQMGQLTNKLPQSLNNNSYLYKDLFIYSSQAEVRMMKGLYEGTKGRVLVLVIMVMERVSLKKSPGK